MAPPGRFDAITAPTVLLAGADSPPGVELDYEVSGAGAPLVLTHGSWPGGRSRPAAETYRFSCAIPACRSARSITGKMSMSALSSMKSGSLIEGSCEGSVMSNTM